MKAEVSSRLHAFASVFECLGVVIGLIGFIVHMIVAYTDGIRRINPFLGVMSSLSLAIISFLALRVTRNPNRVAKQNKFARILQIIFFCIAAFAVSRQIPGSIWGLFWVFFSVVPLFFLSTSKESTASSDTELPLFKISDRIFPLEHPQEQSKGVRCLNRCTTCAYWTWLLVSLVLILSLLSQSIGEAVDYNRYPFPGTKYTIERESGTYDLHLYCTGPASSQPTILLEAGAGGCSTSFWGVQEELAERGRRVCSYDRAGYGWSDGGELPRSMELLTEELTTLLSLAGEESDLLLVGHSDGGQYIQHHYLSFPERVKGLVLLDSFPDYLPIIAPAHNWTQADIESQESGLLSVLDLFRAVTPFGWSRSVFNSQDYVPADKADQHDSRYRRNVFWHSQWADFQSDPPPSNITVGSLPVLVIRAAHGETCEDRGFQEGTRECSIFLQEQELYLEATYAQAERLSTNSTVVLCEYPCDHSFPSTRPAYVVEQILNFGV